MNESFLSLFQAHPWHGVSAWGGSPGVFNAFIEIVPADSVKFETIARSQVDYEHRFDFPSFHTGLAKPPAAAGK